METRLYTELHTRDTLMVEKALQNDQASKLRSANQNMGRMITKDKYHNNREEKAKEKKKKMDEINE